jgi:hypothetical protein
MDFIEWLLMSSRFTAILVVIDWLSKQGIFTSTNDMINSVQLMHLFILHVFSKHGVPTHITSNQGSKFVSHFFWLLSKALDMKLHFTPIYHPEGDGQTEHMNEILEQYLQIFRNYHQNNWAELLPLAEFTYNNTLSATTGVSPSFANKEYHPSMSIHPEQDLSLACTWEFAIDLDELHQELQSQIGIAQQHYQMNADVWQTPAPDFKIGEQAFVKAEHFWTMRPSKKLSNKYLSPFKIIAQAGTHSFMLWLLNHMYGVHPVFHVSQLEPATPNTILNWTQDPPPLVIINDEPEFEISEVLGSKIDKRCHACKLLYLVHWTGYEGTNEEMSWVLATELRHASEIIHDFHWAHLSKPGPLSES